MPETTASETTTSETKAVPLTSFDEIFQPHLNKLRELCAEQEVPVALTIIVDPSKPKTPLVMQYGHILDQATLLADMLRAMRQHIFEQITP